MGILMHKPNKKDPYQMNNLLGKEGYEDIQKMLHKKLLKELKKIGDDNFKEREYYLEKFNLILNSNGKTHADYQGFMKGTGMVQTPRISRNEIQ